MVQMKKIRKVAALAVMVMILAGMTALAATAAQPETISVSLRIEGIEEMLYYNKAIKIDAGASVEDLMTLVNETDETIGIVINGISTDGTYIPEIAGLKEYAYGGYSGWSFRVNDEEPVVGQSLVYLKDGDNVVYYYGDPWGEPGMQYPIPDLSKIYSSGIVSFTSLDTTWDEEYNAFITKNPVVGATVTLNGADYTTDENGGILIEDKSGLAGMQSMKIERYDEASGVPTILRFEPDFEMYVPFADTPDGVWYDYPVEYSVRAGYFRGMDAAKNLFVPGGTTTMAQLITVLGRIAGEDVDAARTPWYQAALDWATGNGIVSDDTFEAGASVTRQTFIYMFYLTAGLVGTYDMTISSDITGAVDYDEINEEYRQAVEWAVASGIISGTTSDALTIAPDEEITRAQVCQMLFNYYDK